MFRECLIALVFVCRRSSGNENANARLHDIVHGLMDPQYITFSRNVYVTVRVQDSECFSAASDSSYIIYLGALTFDSEFIEWYAISSYAESTRDNEMGMTEYTVVIDDLDPIPEMCFSQGRDPCVPRADVIYIQYNNEPEDTWSISRIDVEVQYRLWPGGENWHIAKYEHSVLMPCDSWLDEKALYQIGPRIGLFFKLNDVPIPGQWSKLEFLSWLAVVVIVISVPALAFTAYKLLSLLHVVIEEKRKKSKPIRDDVESARGPGSRRPSNHVISIATIEGKNRPDMSRRPTLPGHSPKPPMTNKVSSISLPGITEPAPKISACCLDEERLLGLGPMPFDIAVVEQERQKELEKLQRAPESPPVAKILNIAHPPSSPAPILTPQPSRQST